MADQLPAEVEGPALVRDLDAYNSLLQVIKSRRSIRRFDPRPVPEEDLMRVLEAGRWAPSGANIQPWAFLPGLGCRSVCDGHFRPQNQINF